MALVDLALTSVPSQFSPHPLQLYLYCATPSTGLGPSHGTTKEAKPYQNAPPGYTYPVSRFRLARRYRLSLTTLPKLDDLKWTEMDRKIRGREKNPTPSCDLCQTASP